jgi:hypothetical protein
MLKPGSADFQRVPSAFFQLPLAHLGAAVALIPRRPRVQFLPGVPVGFSRAASSRLPSARRRLAGFSSRHRACALALLVRSDVGLALSLLLARSSLSFLPFGATKIAPVRFFPADRSLLEAGVFNFEHPKWNFFANSA